MLLSFTATILSPDQSIYFSLAIVWAIQKIRVLVNRFTEFPDFWNESHTQERLHKECYICSKTAILRLYIQKYQASIELSFSFLDWITIEKSGNSVKSVHPNSDFAKKANDRAHARSASPTSII